MAVALVALVLSATGGAVADQVFVVPSGSITRADLSPALQRELVNLNGWRKGDEIAISYLEYRLNH